MSIELGSRRARERRRTPLHLCKACWRLLRRVPKLLSKVHNTHRSIHQPLALPILSLKEHRILPMPPHLLLQTLINPHSQKPKPSPERRRTIDRNKTSRRESTSNSKELFDALLRKARSPKLRQNPKVVDIVLVRIEGYLAK